MAESNKFAVREADFRLFLLLWNQRMRQPTPAIHARMAAWLEHCWRARRKNLLMLAFRASGKSTICGLFAAWLLYRDPELRILVLAADEALAAKMVGAVRRIIERHPLTAHLKPGRADQWAGDRFTVNRMMVQRDPSMIARGITSNITGSRADIVICDDVEVPRTCDTPDKRGALRARLGEISYVLAPGGTQLYIGTPHAWNSIYADAPRPEEGEERAFLEGFSRLTLPVLDACGQSAWPEKYGETEIAALRDRCGPITFASQMMLRPMNIAQGRLDPGLLRVYADEIDYTKELDALFIGEKRMVGAGAFWDPAFGAGKGDASVLAVVFADGEGHFYLHRAAYIKVKAGDAEDEATQQCRAVAAIARELMLASVAVETNGIGGFLPAVLRNAMVREGIRCGVRKVHTTQSKHKRILEAFDAPMAARRLHMHKSVAATPFITEMREWRPMAQGQRDDGLDAAAGAILLQPVRVPRLYYRDGAPPGWAQAAGAQKAKSGKFEI